MSQAAISCMAFYGPFAGANPLTWRARLVLATMAHGIELVAELAPATSLSIPEVIEAMNELTAHNMVSHAMGKTWYNLGGAWVSRRGELLEEHLNG